jgi:Tetratricopeptide repeat
LAQTDSALSNRRHITIEVMGAISEATRGSLRLSHAPSAAEFDAIYRALDEDTARVAGPTEWRPLAVLLLDPSGSVVGGLWGRIAYRWLMIEMLFVPGPMRRRGIGSALVVRQKQRRDDVVAWACRSAGSTFRRHRSTRISALPFSAYTMDYRRGIVASSSRSASIKPRPRSRDCWIRRASWRQWGGTRERRQLTSMYCAVIRRISPRSRNLPRWPMRAGIAPPRARLISNALCWHPQDAESAASRARAIGILRKAVESDPLKPNAHRALGSALLRDGQFAAAASALSQAIALKPDFALANRDLGHAFDRQGPRRQCHRGVPEGACAVA